MADETETPSELRLMFGAEEEVADADGVGEEEGPFQNGQNGLLRPPSLEEDIVVDN